MQKTFLLLLLLLLSSSLVSTSVSSQEYNENEVSNQNENENANEKVQSNELDPLTGKKPRPEFKHSLKGPFFMVRSASIPFWDFGGAAAVTEEYVRLTPAVKSKKGWLWNKRKSQMASWETVIEFRVSGGGRNGADGFAFWYVDEPKIEGPIFGSKDNWNGLALFFDTYDNDGKKDNPEIYAAVNDGSWSLNVDKDGEGHKLGFCKRLFRNSQKPNKIRIRYHDGLLIVDTDLSKSGNYQECFRANVQLPKGYSFGLTSETGFYFDNHDIYSIQTSDLNPLTYAEILQQMKEKRSSSENNAQEQGQQSDQYQPPVSDHDADDLESIRGKPNQNDLNPNSSSSGNNDNTNNSNNNNLNNNNNNNNNNSNNNNNVNNAVIDNIFDRLKALEQKDSQRGAEYAKISEELSKMLHSHEVTMSNLKADLAKAVNSGGSNNNNNNDNNSNNNENNDNNNSQQNPLTEELRVWLERVDDAVAVTQSDIQSFRAKEIEFSSINANLEALRSELRVLRDDSQQKYATLKDVERIKSEGRGDVNTLKSDLSQLRHDVSQTGNATSWLEIIAIIFSSLAILVSIFALKKIVDEKKKYSF